VVGNAIIVGTGSGAPRGAKPPDKKLIIERYYGKASGQTLAGVCVSHSECLASDEGELEGGEYGNKGEGHGEMRQKGRGMQLTANKSQTDDAPVNGLI